MVAYHPGCTRRPTQELGTMDQRSGRRVAVQFGVRRPGAAYRAGATRYKKQAISRPQDGKHGVGTNAAYRRIHIKAAQQSGTWLLWNRREGGKERQYLYRNFMEAPRSIGNTGEGCRLQTWLQGVMAQRRKAWTERLNKQRARSGGKMIWWPERKGAEEGYTGLKPEAEWGGADNQVKARDSGRYMEEALGRRRGTHTTR